MKRAIFMFYLKLTNEYKNDRPVRQHRTVAQTTTMTQ